MEDFNLESNSLKRIEKQKEEEEDILKGLDNIFQLKAAKTISCNEEDECNKFQAYIFNQSNIIKKSLTKISIYLVIFTAIEYIGSVTSNSVGVLTIAAELFTDLTKSIITIISILIIEKPADEIMTYGYHRSEIIASLCSFLIVLVLSIWIVVDSIEIILIPRQINSGQMVIFSILGLCFNLFMRYVKDVNPVPDSEDGKYFKNYANTRKTELESPLLEDYLGIEKKDSNSIIEQISQKQIIKVQKKETIHLVCDVTQSILTIIASLLIYFFQVNHPLVRLIDDICGFTFMIIVLIISLPILKDCIDVLMEAAPRDIKIQNLYNELMDVNGVINVHDIHLWCLSIGRPCITLHILSNYPQKSLEGATKICKKYGINHCTIQVEDSNQERRMSFQKCKLEYDNNIH
jgi:zinc transporter 2